MFLHLSVILLTGGWLVLGRGGESGMPPPGPDTHLSPPPPISLAYGQRAGGTHPTGRHSCFINSVNIVLLVDKLWVDTQDIVIVLAWVASFNSNWFGAKTIDFCTKRGYFFAKMSKNANFALVWSRFHRVWFGHFVRKIIINLWLLPPKPFWIKGGNSGKNNYNVCVDPADIPIRMLKIRAHGWQTEIPEVWHSF